MKNIFISEKELPNLKIKYFLIDKKGKKRKKHSIKNITKILFPLSAISIFFALCFFIYIRYFKLKGKVPINKEKENNKEMSIHHSFFVINN